jgi:hypothetical protein
MHALHFASAAARQATGVQSTQTMWIPLDLKNSASAETSSE